MTLQPLHSECPYIWGKFDFLFLSVCDQSSYPFSAWRIQNWWLVMNSVYVVQKTWSTFRVRSSILVTPPWYVTWQTAFHSQLGTSLADSLSWQTHLTGILTWLADSLSWQTLLDWQTHFPGRLTWLADSLDWQTHFPGRLTWLADSLSWQTHLTGRLTFLADSLDWQTHLTGRLTWLADALDWQTHRQEHLSNPNPSAVPIEVLLEWDP
jgi:hypothetical protein